MQVGAVVRDQAGDLLASVGCRLDPGTTTEAEYWAVSAALEIALGHGVTDLTVLSDSQLVVRQIQGAYNVMNPRLQRLRAMITMQAAQLQSFAVDWIPGDQNREADQLSRGHYT